MAAGNAVGWHSQRICWETDMDISQAFADLNSKFVETVKRPGTKA